MKSINIMDREISIVINTDTRPGIGTGRTVAHGGRGARSWDFLIDNVYVCRHFFEQAHSVEVILLVDVHEPIPPTVMSKLHQMFEEGIIDNLVFRRSVRFYEGRSIEQWKGLFYLEALYMAKGKYVAHFDGDSSAFRDPDSSIVEDLIAWVESGDYDFVSYPSPNSPYPDPLGSMHMIRADYVWVSTRFFFCKRDILDSTEMMNCTLDAETGYIRKNYSQYYEKFFTHPGVLEQILGMMVSTRMNRVFYPLRSEDNDHFIFSWHTYYDGTLSKLRNMEWSQVKHYLDECGGVQGPCDLHDAGVLI